MSTLLPLDCCPVREYFAAETKVPSSLGPISNLFPPYLMQPSSALPQPAVSHRSLAFPYLPFAVGISSMTYETQSNTRSIGSHCHGLGSRWMRRGKGWRLHSINFEWGRAHRRGSWGSGSSPPPLSHKTDADCQLLFLPILQYMLFPCLRSTPNVNRNSDTTQ